MVGTWHSADDHDAFLAGPHDELAGTQRDSYGQIDVRLFDHDRHQAGRGPRLPYPAPLEDDLVRLTAELVVLEPSWAVPPAV